LREGLTLDGGPESIGSRLTFTAPTPLHHLDLGPSTAIDAHIEDDAQR
jgi:hypothetical protein